MFPPCRGLLVTGQPRDKMKSALGVRGNKGAGKEINHRIPQQIGTGAVYTLGIRRSEVKDKEWQLSITDPNRQ